MSDLVFTRGATRVNVHDCWVTWFMASMIEGGPSTTVQYLAGYEQLSTRLCSCLRRCSLLDDDDIGVIIL